MKRVFLALGIIFIFACNKTEVATPPPVIVVQEEAIKFTTNLDTGTYNVADTLPLVITVSSKLPSAGLLYSVLVNWTDSTKQIFKIDTSLSVSSLNLNIPGLQKSGSYSLSVSVSSKSNSTNTINKSISVVNNPLGRFMGYKVAANARQLGTDYWENSILPSDLIVAVFQKNYENHHPSGAYAVWTEAICNGDFNNDGYMDVFNGGTFFGGQIKATLTFLIWNPITKIFEEKNLINDKTNNVGHPRLVTPVYLNSDNYVDIVIHGMRDEASNSNPNEPVSICLSDGKGGYDITKLDLEPKSLANQFGHEWGDVEDVTGDGLPDLFVSANSHSYIFWGINSFPYFTNINFAHFASDTKNFSSDNGFGEVVPSGAGNVYGGVFLDVNKDGQKDLLLAVGENGIQPNGNKDQQRVLLNKGKGRFNETGVIKLPLYSEQINAGINQFDYKVDDLNGDGRLDIIAVNSVKYNQWNIVIYVQQSDGSFLIDNSLVEYNLNTISRPQYKTRLVYSDLNGDGVKDISYINSAITPYYSLQNNEFLTKSVFIRVGNKFVEKDYYQFDPYAKSLRDKYYK